MAAMAAIMAMRWSLWPETVAPPGRLSFPAMTRWSACSSTSAPRTVRTSVTVESRSLSLMRSRAGVHQPGDPALSPEGGHGRQRGHQVGAARYVNLRLTGPGDGPVQPADAGVPLGGLIVQTLNVQPAVQIGGGVPEGRRWTSRPLRSYQRDGRSGPGYPEGAVAVVLHRHAELRQGVHGHADIVRALQGGGEVDSESPGSRGRA